MSDLAAPAPVAAQHAGIPIPGSEQSSSPDAGGAPPAQRITLKLDVLAILGLAGNYRADQQRGIKGEDLLLKYVEPVFAAIGYPLPEKISLDVKLLGEILADVEAKLPARQLAVKYVGRVFEALGYALPPEIVAALTLASEFIK